MPRRIGFSSQLTAAEKAAAIAKLEAIERVILRLPEMAHPEGFYVEPHFGGVSQPSDLGAGAPPLSRTVYEYYLDHFLCGPKGSGTGCGLIRVFVNFSSPPAKSGVHDEQGRTIVFEDDRSNLSFGVFPATRQTVPLATETYFGLSPTDGNTFVKVLLAPDGERPFKPVSREEYYAAMIFEVEGKNGETIAKAREATASSLYQQWLGNAAQRKKEREEALAGMAKAMPAAEVAKMRKTMEDAEREAGEKLKAQASDPEQNRREEAGTHAFGDALRAELARMTPAERKLPAMMDLGRPHEPGRALSGITDHDSPTTVRAFAVNPDFWRVRRSPVEARGMLIEIFMHPDGPEPPPAVYHALWQTYQKLDWAALKSLLDPSG
jgi:hypothetical protein